MGRFKDIWDREYKQTGVDRPDIQSTVYELLDRMPSVRHQGSSTRDRAAFVKQEAIDTYANALRQSTSADPITRRVANLMLDELVDAAEEKSAGYTLDTIASRILHEAVRKFNDNLLAPERPPTPPRVEMPPITNALARLSGYEPHVRVSYAPQPSRTQK